jgi:lysophospholipase L1-like esterase
LTVDVKRVTVVRMHRGIALGVPGVALATAGGLWAQVHHTAHAPLPHFADLDASGTYGRPDGPPVRVAVLGDSSLTGPGLEHGRQIWAAQLADRLHAHVELVSHAKGGSRARDVLERQVDGALGSGADLYVVSVGANDAIHGTSTRTYARQLERIVDELGATAPVVSLGIGDLSMIPRLPLTLRPIVARRSTVIDRAHALVSADREHVVRVPVARLSDPHFRRHGRALFAADLFHPNHHGHRLWSELFLPHVERALGLHDAHVIDLREHEPVPS